MQNEPHVPTLVGILILLIGLGATIFLVENSTKFLSYAAPEDKPQQVTIANITDTSFVVSWVTQNRTNGFIKYKEKNPVSFLKIGYDNRDNMIKTSNRYTHYVNISSLKSNTGYEVVIVSNQHEYNDNKLALKTGSLLPAPAQIIDPAFGTLIDERNHPISEALAYVSFEGSQIISSLVNTDGSWVLPLGEMRSQEGNRYFVPSNKDQERLFFIGREAQSTVVARIDNDAPLPPIRLGENYNFTKLQASRSKVIFAQEQIGGTLVGTAGSSLHIDLPEANANIPSGKPAFKGTATADKKVIITLSGAASIVEKITSSSNGNWNWTPKDILIPGKYVVTVASFNTNNAPVSQATAFTILKSGTSVLGDATPSASLAPSPTPLPSFSPSPSASVTPTTGNWEPTVLVLAVGFLLLTFGSLTFVRKLY